MRLQVLLIACAAFVACDKLFKKNESAPEPGQPVAVETTKREEVKTETPKFPTEEEKKTESMKPMPVMPSMNEPSMKAGEHKGDMMMNEKKTGELPPPPPPPTSEKKEEKKNLKQEQCSLK